jgi:ABC-type phosphate/phosphonate transport system ATPase subunit
MTPTLESAPAQTEFAAGSHARASILKAKNLGFSYPGCGYALRGADLSVCTGAITMILGRSGSGKTTLLKLLAGLMRPSEGECIHCSPAGREPVVAYIPQTLGLVRRHTALENTLTGASRRVGLPWTLIDRFPSDMTREAMELLSRLGLSDKIHVPASRLSGGERQRVAIARALMMRPKLVIADEFVSQLDAITTRRMLELMRSLAANGTGFVVTTHDAEIAVAYADHVVVLREGSISWSEPAYAASAEHLLELLKR